MSAQPQSHAPAGARASLSPLRDAAGRIGGVARQPFGPLEGLIGDWVGTGFNAIWRPHFDAPGAAPLGDHFLMLNMTREHLSVKAVSTAVPNRGLSEPDITLTALQYVQQITDANFPPPLGGGAMHFEPGLWLLVPATADTANEITVNRLASIPHGATILAVGTAETIEGPLPIGATSITPFSVGHPSQTSTFPEQALGGTLATRNDPLPGEITQALLDDPNSLLTSLNADSIAAGFTLVSAVQLTVATPGAETPPQPAGGGVSGIPFLSPTSAASVGGVSATFWIETWKAPDNTQGLILQYSQTVLLNFNDFSWPHVTVGSLSKGF